MGLAHGSLFIFLIYTASNLEEGLISYGICALFCVLGLQTALYAITSRVPPSLQAEHFASGQILSMDSSHLLYFSENLQNSYSAPSLAFNPQRDPVFFSKAEH